MKQFTSILSLVLLIGCAGHSGKVIDKKQSKRDNIVNIHDQITPVDLGDLYVGYGALEIIDDFLIFTNPKLLDGMVHLLDKTTFEYIGGGVQKGRGPGEVINMGRLFVDEPRRRFFLPDHSKLKIFEYDVDKFLEDPVRYLPEEKVEMSNEKLMSQCQFVNDTLCFGSIVESIGTNDFRILFGRWNMKTGEFSHEQREVKGTQKRRTSGCASIENNLIVEVFQREDLIQLSTIEGELQCNILGPAWAEGREVLRFRDVKIYGDRIVAAYCGKEYTDPTAFFPEQLIIFDLKGNYLRTLDPGVCIMSYCIDEQNRRVLLSIDDETMQMGYFDLDLIVK